MHNSSLLETQLTTTSLPNDLPSGYASESIVLGLDANALVDASSIVVVVDDNGSGTSLIQECSERDNGIGSMVLFVSNNSIEVPQNYCLLH